MPQAYKIMTVKIDQSNSNPATCCTYYDDAEGMTAGSEAWDEFFGHYPCLFKEGAEVGKLNRNDFTKFEGGTDADITSGEAGDVMIAFPRRGLRISTTDDMVTISMTDNPNDPNFEYYAHSRGTTAKDVFYLGAYQSCMPIETNQKLRSLSDTLPIHGGYMYQIRECAQANGNGYEIFAFYQLTFIQAMYVLKYKNLNSNEVIGRGYIYGEENPKTGKTNLAGMDFGDKEKTDVNMKLFGIEDFWGSYQEWIDGIYIDDSCHILTATNNFNRESLGYTDNGQGATDNVYGMISKIQGTSETGFIIKEAKGSSSTYYCSYGRIRKETVGCFGESYTKLGSGSYSSAYVFKIDCTFSVTTNRDKISSRLMYL